MTPREQYIEMYTADVAKYSDHYKQGVVDDPKAAAESTIDGLDDNDIKQFIRDLKGEQKALAKHGH